MTIGPIERNKLSTIVFSSTEPLSTSVLWGKPVGNNITLYIFRKGSWVGLKSEELEPIVQAYIDSQDLATLTSAQKYSDNNLAAEVTRATEAESVIQKTANTNATDISTLKGYFDGEAANKAKQLTTTVELWGNKFDGTQSITGDLINIGTTGNSKFCIQGIAADVDYTHLYITQEHSPLVMQKGYGNVGIGTETPTTKLEVAEEFKATQDATIGGNLTVAGSISSTASPLATKKWVTTVIEEVQPKVWANVLAIKDTAIKVDGEKVELPAYKPVIIKNFSSVEPWTSRSEETKYLSFAIIRFDFHYNDKSPMVPINAFRLSYTNVPQIDISCWDTSEMTSMYEIFRDWQTLTQLDVRGFDTSNVTDMTAAFCGLRLTSLDVSNFNTSKVTNMTQVFYAAYNLNPIDVSKWNTSNVTTMNQMFHSCRSLTSLDLSNWDLPKLASCTVMFGITPMLTNIKFGEGWGKSPATLTLDLSACASSKSYNLTDATYESMLNMYDRVANGLTETFIIQFSSKHNVPNGWAEKMSAKGYTITIS